MLYLDASVLVALFAPDAHNEEVRNWISARESEAVAISRWGEVEFAAVLSAKARAGALNADEKKEVLSLYRQLAATSFARLETGERQFAEAIRLGEVGAAGLRGADALHLAIAATHGCTLCTLDRRQADAAEELGLSVERIGNVS